MVMQAASSHLASHSASAPCRVPASEALAFLADGLQLGTWAFGCWQAEAVGGGVVRGRSLFDDSTSWVRPTADAASMTVVYHVGGAPDALTPRIHALVQADPAGCRISLHATRTADMDDARWLRLVRCHELEVLLIQARLERRAAGGSRVL
ncbi:MAG: hypothetical protein JWQ76_2497 [Ramlibacter sp.]|nr:hypothetical protein [Ramlibacter sp.]